MTKDQLKANMYLVDKFLPSPKTQDVTTFKDVTEAAAIQYAQMGWQGFCPPEFWNAANGDNGLLIEAEREE